MRGGIVCASPDVDIPPVVLKLDLLPAPIDLPADGFIYRDLELSALSFFGGRLVAQSGGAFVFGSDREVLAPQVREDGRGIGTSHCSAFGSAQ